MSGRNGARTGWHVALVALTLVLSVPVAPARGQGPDAGDDELCAATMAALQRPEGSDAGRQPQLARVDHDLGEPVGGVAPRLCLLHYPALAVYRAVLVPVEAVEAFRALKARVLARYLAEGVDVCRIGAWDGLGRNGVLSLDGDDRYQVPAACTPHGVAADPGAAAWLPLVRDALDRARERTAETLGWRPDRALTVLVATEPSTALSLIARPLPEAARDYQEYQVRLIRQGESSFREDTYGNVVLLTLYPDRGYGLDRPAEVLRARLATTVAHEYTHFAQHSLTRGNPVMPMWFLEGQAVYQEGPPGNRHALLLSLALTAVREGTAPRLRDLRRQEDWVAREQAGGRVAAYSRAYAAVLYLVERHGFAATVQLLRDNAGGSHARFDALLQALTGLDAAALDAALDAWLVTSERVAQLVNAPNRVLLRDDFSSAASGWPRASSQPEQVWLGYVDGEYAVRRLAGSGAAPFVGARVPGTDYLAEVSARLLPPSADAYVSLYVRRQDAGDTLIFDVEPDAGAFRLRRVADQQVYLALDWTATPAVRPGEEWNRLGIRAQGPDLTLFINGVEVGHARDDAPREGRVGFGVTSRVDGTVEARFDNLLVTRLE